MKIPQAILHELESNLFLCATNILHDSGELHEQQEQSAKNSNVAESIKKNVKLCHDLRDHLLRGELDNFAAILDKSWALKKTFSGKITDSKIDSIYALAKKNGAMGGKLWCGGGGFLLFYVQPQAQNQFLKCMQQNSVSTERVNFETQGARSWRSSIDLKR